MQLVLNTHGLLLSQRNRCFQVQSGTESRLISPVRITSILITKAAHITSSAILLAAENNIPVILVNSVGQPVVKMQPVMAKVHSDLRRKQYEFSKGETAMQWVLKMLVQKTEGQIANLARWAHRKPRLAEICNAAKDRITASLKGLRQKANDPTTRKQFLEGLHGWEGANARHYWQVVAQLAQQEGYNMQGRSYHPADDEVNATLNYLYGMLYHQVETALACAGLDSQLGLWHRDVNQTPSLSFDIIEPLRPQVDLLLTELLMQKQWQAEWFETHEKYGYVLTNKGKAITIPLFNAWLEEKVKMQNEISAMKNHILQQAYNLRNEIEKTILLDE